MRLPLILAALTLATPVCAEDITVFAAASLKNALDQIATDWQTSTGNAVAISYAGSSQLAKQIELGAPADIFISASTDWMDTLQTQDLIVTDSRVDLLGNRLVLIAHDTAAAPVELSADLDLAGLLGKDGKLAMALVDSVPAGVYGKQALTSLGLWPPVEPMVAQADNVRAALLLVSTGEAPMGVVYASDAYADDAVKVVATFPAASHDPIIYPAARMASSTATTAQDFLTILSAPAAAAVFEEQGFTMLAK